MPTTPYGLHYPAATAPPNVPADMQLLAQDVELIFKTPWTAFPTTVTGTSRYRVIGSIVFVQVDGGLATTTGAQITISTTPLPLAVRPTVVTARTAAYFTGYAGILSVTPAGDVLAIQTSGANKTSVSGIVIYPV